MVNMRQFTKFEKENIKFLINHNIEFTQVEVTPTGLKKYILDATVPMRTFFVEKKVHDYALQEQGPENKVFYPAIILTEGDAVKTEATFYRPRTKKGDPRIWIHKLGSYTNGNDIHVIFVFERTLYLANLTTIDFRKVYESTIITPLQEVIKAQYGQSGIVADELLGKFRSVSGQWFQSEVMADTGIGRTIESFLGITMNSEKTPDYKGIELKSHREKRRSNKNVLFTQAPDWDISKLKSGKQIVEKYGYYLGEKKTYHNTVQCTHPNSQNLFLNVEVDKQLLELKARLKKDVDVAVWRLLKLHNRLSIKHHETFWIEVENVINDGKEYFRYKEIEHTKNPNIGQFDILIEQNIITIDLLLSRSSRHGDTYSFKIKKRGMPLLFPESVKYVI